MWFYNILTVVVSIIVAIAVLYLLFRLFALKQGDEKVILLPKRATNFQVSDRNFESITLFCDVPFVNKGRQNGTIMDLFPRPLLPEEQFDSVKVDAWAMDITAHVTMDILKLLSLNHVKVALSVYMLR